jgi:hypothetical protein
MCQVFDADFGSLYFFRKENKTIPILKKRKYRNFKMLLKKIHCLLKSLHIDSVFDGAFAFKMDDCSFRVVKISSSN